MTPDKTSFQSCWGFGALFCIFSYMELLRSLKLAFYSPPPPKKTQDTLSLLPKWARRLMKEAEFSSKHKSEIGLFIDDV